MKTKLFVLLLAGMNLMLFSCDMNDNHVIPSNKVTTQQFTISDYDMIDASSAFTVYLTFSDTEESIEIEANDNLHQHIEVKKVNNVLEVGFENNFHVTGSATLNAYIKTKNISGYMASGASRFIVEDPIMANEVSIYLSGASTFTGEVESNNLFADLSGASIMNINGKVNSVDLEASGASVVRDYGLGINKLKADLSGASNAQLTIMEEIDIIASGASVLNYKGSAVIARQDLSGASEIKKVN